MEGIFLLLTKPFNIVQYVAGAISVRYKYYFGIVKFLPNLLIYFPVAAKIISVHKCFL